MDVRTLAGSAVQTQPAPSAQAAVAVPVSSSQPAASQNGQNVSHVLGDTPKQKPGIAPVIAKIFGNESNPTQVALNVTYKVEGNHILTVFSDPTTGQEIAQFPPDLLAHIATFFDQQQGVTLDQNA